jgi:CheY-like chemotaxis protein
VSNVRNIKGVDRQASRKILVVEDNLDSVHSMAVLIKMMGHECQFAINGLAALKIAREFRPDVILLDIGLPDFKGYDIAKQLRYEPGLENTRIIAVTGRSEYDRELALDAGCDEFYRKPIETELLEQLLESRFGREAFSSQGKESG